MPFGVRLVTTGREYITARPYLATHDGAHFKKNTWNISVRYRSDGGIISEKERVFFVGLPKSKKAEAYQLAKDVVVVLAGGRSTKQAAEWAKLVKERG
jgi:hypothetical protein